MAKEQFRKARLLMDAHKYKEAAKILAQIDHPTARRWLQEIEETQPGATAGIATGKGAGSSLPALIGVVVFLVVAAAAAAGYALLNRSGGVLPSLPQQVAVNTTPALNVTSTPEPTPTPSPTPLPCEPSLWWNANARALIDTLNSYTINQLTEADITQTDIDERVPALQTHRQTIVATPTPDCLAAARDLALVAVDRLVAFYQLPSIIPYSSNRPNDVSPTEVRTVTTAYADALEAGVALIAELRAQDVPFQSARESGIDAPLYDAYTDLTSDVCPAARYFAVELSVFRIVRLQADALLADRNTNIEDLRLFRFNILNTEREYLRALTPPECLINVQTLMTDVYTAYTDAVLARFNGDAATEQSALRTMRASLQELDTLLTNYRVPKLAAP